MATMFPTFVVELYQSDKNIFPWKKIENLAKYTACLQVVHFLLSLVWYETFDLVLSEISVLRAVRPGP